jgi:hypothetical protein
MHRCRKRIDTGVYHEQKADASPKPSPANPTNPSPALKAAATSAAPFVPGTFDLGASACVSTAPAGKEAAQGEPDAKKPVENGAMPPPSKVLQAKRPATLAVADPASTPPSQQPAPAEPEVFSGRFAGNLKLSRDLGKKYSLRVMKLLQHDQRYIEMEQNRPELKSQIEEFCRLLEQAAELDASKDMPPRQESKGGGGAQRAGGPGTPKGVGRGTKSAEPLRDRKGNIIEVGFMCGASGIPTPCRGASTEGATFGPGSQRCAALALVWVACVHVRVQAPGHLQPPTGHLKPPPATPCLRLNVCVFCCACDIATCKRCLYASISCSVLLKYLGGSYLARMLRRSNNGVCEAPRLDPCSPLRIARKIIIRTCVLCRSIRNGSIALFLQRHMLLLRFCYWYCW